jgi:hypothetical protein
MNLKEICWEGMDCLYLAEEMGQLVGLCGWCLSFEFCKCVEFLN